MEESDLSLNTYVQYVKEKLLDTSNIVVNPKALEEEPEAYNQCFSTLIFPTKNRSSQLSSWPNSLRSI